MNINETNILYTLFSVKKIQWLVFFLRKLSRTGQTKLNKRIKIRQSSGWNQKCKTIKDMESIKMSIESILVFNNLSREIKIYPSMLNYLFTNSAPLRFFSKMLMNTICHAPSCNKSISIKPYFGIFFKLLTSFYII